MNILIACEESQRITIEMRNKGHNCFSCDFLEPSGRHPEWHILGDCIPILNGKCTFKTMDNIEHYIEKWDMIIAHPPCTYLSSAGNAWFNEKKYGDKAKERKKLREEAFNFFMEFTKADCDKIAIENPIGYMNSHYRKPDQIVQPYFFGDPYTKSTCLWLKGLPKLKKENECKPEDPIIYKNGKKDISWHFNTLNLSSEERRKERSKTFPGFAKAIANQWG